MDTTEEVPPAEFDAGRMSTKMDQLIQTAGITKLENTNRIYRLYKWAEKTRSINRTGQETPEKKFETIINKCKKIKENGIDENGIMEILEIVFSRKSHADSVKEIKTIIYNTVNNDIKCHSTGALLYDRVNPINNEKCGDSYHLATEMLNLVDRDSHHISTMHDYDPDADPKARQRYLDKNYSFEHNRGGRKTNRRKNKRKTRKNKRLSSWKNFKQRPRKIPNWTF